MESQLRACVQQSLENFMYSNAKFMAERLYAEFASEVCPRQIFYPVLSQVAAEEDGRTKLAIHLELGHGMHTIASKCYSTG